MAEGVYALASSAETMDSTEIGGDIWEDNDK